MLIYDLQLIDVNNKQNKNTNQWPNCASVSLQFASFLALVDRHGPLQAKPLSLFATLLLLVYFDPPLNHNQDTEHIYLKRQSPPTHYDNLIMKTSLSLHYTVTFHNRSRKQGSSY